MHEQDEKHNKKFRLVSCRTNHMPVSSVLLLPLVAGTALGSYFTDFKDVIFIVMGLLFVFALFKGWRKLDPETKNETKRKQNA